MKKNHLKDIGILHSLIKDMVIPINFNSIPIYIHLTFIYSSLKLKGAEPSHMYCNSLFGKWYMTESCLIPKKLKERTFTNIHFYWRQLKNYSKPQPHQMIISAIRGYVVTQNLRKTNAILWVDKNYDWIENSEKEEWQKLKEFVHVRVYNSSEESKGTPLEGWVIILKISMVFFFLAYLFVMVVYLAYVCCSCYLAYIIVCSDK